MDGMVTRPGQSSYMISNVSITSHRILSILSNPDLLSRLFTTKIDFNNPVKCILMQEKESTVQTATLAISLNQY